MNEGEVPPLATFTVQCPWCHQDVDVPIWADRRNAIAVEFSTDKFHLCKEG